MMQRDTVVCSFWVHRPADFPNAPDYLQMLKILDESVKRAGMYHVVLTDHATAPKVQSELMMAQPFALPRNLLQATTEAQAQWLAWPGSAGVDSVFVGADCLVLRDFRPYLNASADFSAVHFEHKRLWFMNGFMHVPAHTRAQLAPLFREVADDTHPMEARSCDDMQAFQRAFGPKPEFPYGGPVTRRGLQVQYLREEIWNGRPHRADEDFGASYVLHFRGPKQKPLFVEWARHWGFA